MRGLLLWALIITGMAQRVLVAAPLNDTGQTNFGNASDNSLSSEPADYPKQDARIGRDAAAQAGKLSKQGGGRAGFDFTKLDDKGQPLAANATNHVCVRDNVTGLIWEVKTKDKGLRDQSWTYTWYNSDANRNGGSAGTANGGKCFDKANCDSEKFVQQVNATQLCGFQDWRLPKRSELQSIVDYSRVYPSIDSDFFPNTVSDWFWSSSPDAGHMDGAWNVIFNYGYVDSVNKGNANAVRLVRGGQ